MRSVVPSAIPTSCTSPALLKAFTASHPESGETPMQWPADKKKTKIIRISLSADPDDHVRKRMSQTILKRICSAPYSPKGAGIGSPASMSASAGYTLPLSSSR